MLTQLRRWLFYFKVAGLDLFRMPTSLILQIVIVTGICLPVLILLGLKRGHIAELRHELVTSPTGRQVVMSVGGRGEMLTSDVIAKMEAEFEPIEIIVPDTERVADLSRLTDGKPVVASGVTLRSSRIGDPILEVHQADVLAENELGIVLYDSIANTLKVGVNDEVTLIVKRRIGRQEETATTTLTVKAILESDSNENVGYVHYGLIDLIERYVRGGKVAEFNWPPMKGSARDRYSEYLLFCEAKQNLTADDLAAYSDRGYIIEEVVDGDLVLLYGLLTTESLNKLVVYRVFTPRSRSDPAHRMAVSPRDLTAISAVDDIAIPWNTPRYFSLTDQKRLLVGISLPKRTWLKLYLHDPEAVCSYLYDSENVPVIFPFQRPPDDEVTLKFGVDHSLRLYPQMADQQPASSLDKPLTLSEPTPNEGSSDKEESPSEEPSSDDTHAPSSPIDIVPAEPEVDTPKPHHLRPVIVPVQLLAHLDAYQTGQAEFDQKSKQFIPVPPSPTYTQARLYARTIDDVLPVIDILAERSYAYRAQNSRIKEIQGQDQQLQDLVLIVGASVFLFGIITVFSVLMDATERKRGTIGILRVMGVSRSGIFAIVFLRAIAVGLLAGLLTWGLGSGVTAALNWQPVETSRWLNDLLPNVSSVINQEDVVLILVAATFCCLVGSILPAWKASQRDPFDAIAEGKFK